MDRQSEADKKMVKAGYGTSLNQRKKADREAAELAYNKKLTRLENLENLQRARDEGYDQALQKSFDDVELKELKSLKKQR